MIITALHFKIKDTKYRISGLHLVGKNHYIYDVINEESGEMKSMGKDKLIEIIKKYNAKFVIN